MKDTSRPHPFPLSRSAPYKKKRKSSGNVSPSHVTRRAHDATQPQDHSRVLISTPHSGRAYTSRTISTDDEPRSLSKTGGNCVAAISHARRHSSTDGSVHKRPSHTSSSLSIHPDIADPPLPPPLTSTAVFTGQTSTPGSATPFLRTIKLSDKPPSLPPLQTSFSLTPPSLRLPPLSADNTNRTPCSANASGNGYQINLVYKGYPFSYDLSALPEDPKGTIALLAITKSDPGAYILVGAHYRRTGRSRAARAVIRSLLDNLDSSPDVEKVKTDAAPTPASEIPLVTLGPPCSKPIDQTTSVVKSAAVRPAMLLLAACELDISREHPDDPESASHASAAYDLFRAIYGTVNDAIVAGAVRPQPKNALGLEFSSNRNYLSLSPSELNSHPPSNASPPEVGVPARVKDLEKELSTAHATQKQLEERLKTSDDRLKRAEDKVHVLESGSQEMLVQLDAWRDENWELRQQLAESEQRVRELVHCAPSAENRIWGRLKDLLFDNLGGVHGE